MPQQLDKKECKLHTSCQDADTCGGPIAMLLAKSIIKNKCWIVEQNGAKIGTIMTNPSGVVYQHDQQREQFKNLKLLSDRYNIIVEKTAPKKVISQSHEVYGYPCEHKPHNVLWDLRHKLPIFTKSPKSKSFFSAGYYIVKFNNGWVKSYCPKLITLNRYPYAGPYDSFEEMQERLRIANGALHGTTIKPASEEI
jgi:hypothetical protein